MNMFKFLRKKPEKLIGEFLTDRHLTISTAESCTGGLVSSRLTDVAGSSNYIRENYVTYANEAKSKLLGVSEETLKQFGAVSEQCAREMATGLLERTGSDFVLCTTGIAGPGGGTKEKPVGTMYVAAKNKHTTKVKKINIHKKYERKKMKYVFSQKALEVLLELLEEDM